MSTAEVRSNDVSRIASVDNADMKLEVVVIPVSEAGRPKEFYPSLGWRLDADRAAGDDFRLIQFTPPGSGCSVQIGTNLTSALAWFGPGPVPHRLRHRSGASSARPTSPRWPSTS